MISSEAYRYCKEPLSRVENYDEAVSSPDKWDVHHRLELTLDGQQVHGHKDLKRLGMYYRRPAFELVFIEHKAHIAMHHKACGGVWFGRTENKHTAATKRKISEGNKGKVASEETRRKQSIARKGKKHKPVTEEVRRKLAEKTRAWWAAHPEAHKVRLANAHKARRLKKEATHESSTHS